MDPTPEGSRPIIDAGAYYYRSSPRSGSNPATTCSSRLTQVTVDRGDGVETGLDDEEIAGFASLLGGAGAETVTKLVGNAVVLFTATPTSGSRSSTTREDPARGRGDPPLRCRRRSTRAGTRTRSASSRAARSPPGSRCCSSPARRRATRAPSTAPTTSTSTGRRAWPSASATACTAASAPPSPAWRAASRSRSWRSAGGGSRSTRPACAGSTCRTSPATRTSRCPPASRSSDERSCSRRLTSSAAADHGVLDERRGEARRRRGTRRPAVPRVRGRRRGCGARAGASSAAEHGSWNVSVWLIDTGVDRDVGLRLADAAMRPHGGADEETVGREGEERLRRRPDRPARRRSASTRRARPDRRASGSSDVDVADDARRATRAPLLSASRSSGTGNGGASSAWRMKSGSSAVSSTSERVHSAVALADRHRAARRTRGRRACGRPRCRRQRRTTHSERRPCASVLTSLPSWPASGGDERLRRAAGRRRRRRGPLRRSRRGSDPVRRPRASSEAERLSTLTTVASAGIAGAVDLSSSAGTRMMSARLPPMIPATTSSSRPGGRWSRYEHGSARPSGCG